MLPVRQVTSSLLRHSIRRSQPVQTFSLLPSHAFLAHFPLEFPLSRSFSKNSRNHGHGKKLANNSPMDLPTTLNTFYEIQDADTVKLNKSQASRLVTSLVKHQRLGECAELLQIFQKHQVQLKPVARLKAFSVLCLKKKSKMALHEFENLCKEKEIKLMPWVFGGALDAATRLNRQEVVKKIFLQSLKTEENIQVSGEGVYEMLKDVRERGVKVSEFAFHALVFFSEKSSQPDMTLEVLSMMQKEGFQPTVDLYSSVLVVGGRNERWNDVVKVFEEIPEKLVAQLNAMALDHVVMAHVRCKSEALTKRGLEIFGKHKEKCTKLAHAAALEGLLQTDQLDGLLALANEMQRREMTWDSSVYKFVALAYIRSGSVDKARIFLHTNVTFMKDDSVPCYNELIQHYANTNGDVEAACQLYLEMIRSKHQLTAADWINALELALQCADQTIYWKIRKQLWLLDRNVRADLPEHLILPDLDGLEGYAFKQSRAQTTTLEPTNLSQALRNFQEIRRNNGLGLTVNVASTLLAIVAQHDRADSCLEMWRYFEERGVFPKLFARWAAFTAMSNKKQYDHTLELFNSLMLEKAAPSAWAYTRALDAASKLKKHSSVAEILRHMQDHGVKITVYDYTEIIKGCTQAKEWTLALTILSAMQKQGLKPPSDTFNALLNGCGKGNLWNMVIEVYNGMPDDRRQFLDAKALGSVLLAHSQAGSEELQMRIVAICNDHKKTCKPFPYEMALIALLEVKQYSEVISLATDATNHGFELTPLMCHIVVMTHIRSGSMEQARQLLDQNAKRLSNMSVECYRELIQYYAEVHDDTLEASKMCVFMMQNNTEVSVDDWRTALELALQLPDRATYWKLRKLLRLHGVPLSEFREHLLLSDDNHEFDNAASLQ